MYTRLFSPLSCWNIFLLQFFSDRLPPDLHPVALLMSPFILWTEVPSSFQSRDLTNALKRFLFALTTPPLPSFYHAPPFVNFFSFLVLPLSSLRNPLFSPRPIFQFTSSFIQDSKPHLRPPPFANTFWFSPSSRMPSFQHVPLPKIFLPLFPPENLPRFFDIDQDKFSTFPSLFILV